MKKIIWSDNERQNSVKNDYNELVSESLVEQKY